MDTKGPVEEEGETVFAFFIGDVLFGVTGERGRKSTIGSPLRFADILFSSVMNSDEGSC